MRVQDYFVGKNIFLTGGSGFIGKILIDKLLRSCPDVGNIYILLRSKKGKSPQERWTEITKNILFDKLKETNPENLKKVIPIEGDVVELGLGINESDRQLLIQNVHLVYHIAASVRFDDPLKNSIFTNVRSTREIIELSKEMKNIDLFIHISTTYCNSDKLEVDEKIYPSHGNWRDAIQLAEQGDPMVIDAMTQKYINPLPNTYTYCKSLAEHTVVDLCKGQIPAIIMRPSIVVSTMYDPFTGWNDNLNGPIGLMIAIGKGLLRTAFGGNGIQDYIPVDVVARMLILATVDKNTKRDLDEVDVYNVSKYNVAQISVKDTIDMGAKLIQDIPFSEILWYPRPSMTKCWYYYYFQVLLFHMLPAFFFDIILRITGKKPILFNIQRKIYIANCVLAYFIRNNWQFINNKSIKLAETVAKEDLEEFKVTSFSTMSREEIYQYFKTCKMVGGQLMFKEDYSDIEKNKRNLYRLWLLDLFAKMILFILLFWYLFIKHDIIKYLGEAVIRYFDNL